MSGSPDWQGWLFLILVALWSLGVFRMTARRRAAKRESLERTESEWRA